MFGAGGALIGWIDPGIARDYSHLLPDGVPLWAFAIFQTVFCATSATIVSGAMAERTKFSAYCIYSACISIFIYPISGHWIWGGGWLSQLGFHDFAGSTAVHMVGGICALIGAKTVSYTHLTRTSACAPSPCSIPGREACKAPSKGCFPPATAPAAKAGTSSSSPTGGWTRNIWPSPRCWRCRRWNSTWCAKRSADVYKRQLHHRGQRPKHILFGDDHLRMFALDILGHLPGVL